jgi:phosphatidylserine/phosphatidylglycerophosphate/cardiolipin synthase-like enzyme
MAIRLRLGQRETRAFIKPKGQMQAAFLVRDNIRHRRDIEAAYLQAIDQAQCEIILANAYFLPGLNFRHALLAAAGRGVRVVLLLQGKRDHPLFHYASHALYGNFSLQGLRSMNITQEPSARQGCRDRWALGHGGVFQSRPFQPAAFT